MNDIALMGRAGAGKDTAAAELVARHGYARVAFADPLKAMALAVDPWIECGCYERRRLTEIVNAEGWDSAKRNSPEVRRFLQRLGLEGARATFGENAWLLLALREIGAHREAGRPVVVTDVRFRNEWGTLWNLGFTTVWVDRPGIEDGKHASEAELSASDADFRITNDGDPARLYEQLTRIASNRYEYP
ncbi:hypothetical protein BKA00_007439 [Actinomadura coerulea]|uniref:Adenylate kinase n=1 Tax=Actinomadura coerulea TaxID=46159 RepID=A0A7X0G8L6_9ACTN|nr:hypothetical protein [Actinomadura coerulea]MBB6400525.1 hypothetical protein [Actinomadura coerulea]GGQ07844.1 hypothetical protein GCM10010187_24920 [Actinomadura coerulea]